MYLDETHNSLTQHKLYIFHPMSYKYTASFGVRPPSGKLIQKYLLEEEI